MIDADDGMADLIGDFIARRDPWRPAVDGNWWLGPQLNGERPAVSAPETGAD